jgi:hypothetical protein
MEAILILSFIAFVFIVRLFGAWMLRIDELIKGQEKQSALMMTIIKKLGDDPENNREKQEA